LEIDDLRLTLEEGIDFLEQVVSERPLAYSEMQLLVKRTEGWIAGLKLAALALNQQADRRHFTATFTGTHAYLREYFIDSMLHHNPHLYRRFCSDRHLRNTTGICNARSGKAWNGPLAQYGSGLVLVRLGGLVPLSRVVAEMLNE
jgi:LuxR family maltose regulon positive regulatory protein